VTLLETKLYPPPVATRHIDRPHILARIDTSRRLTLVSAPAGYGKTELVSVWFTTLDTPALWLTLHEYDDDFTSFGDYLVACIRHLQPTLQLEFQSPELIPYAGAQLVNAISSIKQPVIWVLDDYHHITDPYIHQLIQFLLDHQPPNLHLILITREDPPLELPRLRVRQQLNEIRERDLRFNRQEVEQFLGQSLSTVQIDYLLEQTEGWIASLQIVALAMQEGVQSIEQFTGQDRYITDYLIAEVLAKLPSEIQQFLRQTAVLERLTTPLCNALTDRNDSHLILDFLHQKNIFLIPLDRQRQAYRYHVLFRQFLQTLNSPNEQAAIYDRALRWYEAQGLWEDAVAHALHLGRLGQDYAQAIRLMESRVEQLLSAGAIPTLNKWFDALPKHVIQTSKWLLLLQAWTYYLKSDLQQCENSLDQITEPEPLTHVLRCQLAFARDDYELATYHAQQVLAQLPDSPSRLTALWILAEAQQEMGQIAVMIDSFQQIALLTPANQISGIMAQNFLAVALNNSGKWQQALTVVQQALEAHTSPIIALLHATAGKLFYETNELVKSHQHFEKARELATQSGINTLQMLSYSDQSPLLYAQGRTEAAFASLETAYGLAQTEFLGKPDWAYAIGVRLYLLEGDLLKAQSLAAYLPSDHPTSYKYIDGQIGYGRWLIARNQLTDAQQWLDRLEDFLQTHKLRRWLLTVSLLQALIAERWSDMTRCYAYLTQAVQIAAPENYLRAFLDEDPHLLTLLPAVRSVAPNFVDQILEAVDLTLPASMIEPTGSLLDPLTPRELEVLHLVALGYSNGEIADKLVVAVSTVKRHINNVYSKLGVTRRSQAILKAQQLDLI
jgi:LuxR family transcriptional regulator, maltose regulon positive regulatory protein